MTKLSTRDTVIVWIAKLVAAGFLGGAAFLKFKGHDADVVLFEKIGMEPGGRYAVAAFEALAALLILVPQSSIYGAILGLCVMTGAIIGHLTVLGLAKLQFAVLVFLACLTVLYIRRRDAPFLRNLLDR